jgi:hypothetical protein
MLQPIADDGGEEYPEFFAWPLDSVLWYGTYIKGEVKA